MDSNNTQSYPSGTADGLYACGYARDSTYYMVAGSTGLIYMFNASSSTLESTFVTNSTSRIRSLQFSSYSNYFLAGNSDGTVYFYYRFCNGCPVGSYMSQTTCRLCATSLVGCSICISSSVCKSCMSGYYYSSNACRTCNIMLGCGNCNSSTRCTTCITGYYLNGLTCTRCLSIQYGCHQCTGPFQCLECDKNSYLNAGICIACKTLYKCLYCNSSSYCQQCVPGYYLNAGVCTSCESSVNPYCLIC
jgi:WD40 repeat protein